MLGGLKSRVLRLFGIAAALVPWLLAMYLFFWLDSSGTWTSETPHRGKLSVLILASGMALSFLCLSFVTRRGN